MVATGHRSLNPKPGFRGADMQSTITVEGKVLGRKKPLFADWSIPFPPDLQQSGNRITLRDLLTRIVREEVRAFRERQEQRRLTRVLMQDEIEQGARAGKVDMGGRNLDQEVDGAQAVDAVLQAFEDKLFLVFVDGEQPQELDYQVYLEPDSRVTFVRLVMLAGG
jgi:hypothetical protein